MNRHRFKSRFPVVNGALIAVNFAVWLFYELLNGDAAVNRPTTFSPISTLVLWFPIGIPAWVFL
jgi:hypothetical protein